MMAYDDETVGSLVREIIDESRTLLRQEVELARTEIREKAERTWKGARFMGIGAAGIHASAFVLLAAAVLGFTLLLEGWLGALGAAAVSCAAVGGGAAAAGAILVRRGRRRLDLLPRETVETIAENARWAGFK